MHCVTNIHEDLYWLGGSDRQLAKFENVFPIPRGVSYNAYLVLDEKTVLLDTVDKAVGERFFENLEFALAGRPLDYVVVNHMEPDHCATLGELLRRWPGAQVVANAKTVPMVSQFFDCDISNRPCRLLCRHGHHHAAVCRQPAAPRDFRAARLDPGLFHGAVHLRAPDPPLPPRSGRPSSGRVPGAGGPAAGLPSAAAADPGGADGGLRDAPRRGAVPLNHNPQKGCISDYE